VNDFQQALIAFLILGPMILAMIAQAYIAYRYTEHFESLLPNCAFVIGNKKSFEHAGLPGKLLRTGLISVVLAIPQAFMHRNLINLEEVERFPTRPRRLLVSLPGLHLALLLALTIFNYTVSDP
jgi:hypothetical protein